MEPLFIPDRLQQIREMRNLNKSEAARLLDLSKMGYLRYETAERTPSYQTIVFMAQKLGTSPEYLTGMTDDPSPQEFLVSRNSDPELFSIVQDVMIRDSKMRERLFAYYQLLTKELQQN